MGTQLSNLISKWLFPAFSSTSPLVATMLAASSWSSAVRLFNWFSCERTRALAHSRTLPLFFFLSPLPPLPPTPFSPSILTFCVFRRCGAQDCRELPVPLHWREGRQPALQGLQVPPCDPPVYAAGRGLYQGQRDGRQADLRQQVR